jgi:hypothetical protein
VRTKKTPEGVRGAVFTRIFQLDNSRRASVRKFTRWELIAVGMLVGIGIAIIVVMF